MGSLLAAAAGIGGRRDALCLADPGAVKRSHDYAFESPEPCKIDCRWGSHILSKVARIANEIPEYRVGALEGFFGTGKEDYGFTGSDAGRIGQYRTIDV